MKWYEWILITGIVLFVVSIPSAYFYKKMNEPIYVVDISKLIDDKFSYKEIRKVYNNQVSPEQFMLQKKRYLDKIQRILENFDRPVFVKQTVFGGNTIDITEEVKKYLE